MGWKSSNSVEQLQMNDIKSDIKCKVVQEFQIGSEYEENDIKWVSDGILTDIRL